MRDRHIYHTHTHHTQSHTSLTQVTCGVYGVSVMMYFTGIRYHACHGRVGCVRILCADAASLKLVGGAT